MGKYKKSREREKMKSFLWNEGKPKRTWFHKANFLFDSFPCSSSWTGFPIPPTPSLWGMEELHHLVICSTLLCRGPWASSQRGGRHFVVWMFTQAKGSRTKTQPCPGNTTFPGSEELSSDSSMAGCCIPVRALGLREAGRSTSWNFIPESTKLYSN